MGSNTQYRGSDGILRSIPLDGDNIEDKLQKLKDDLISHFMNEDIDEKALNRFFKSIVKKLNVNNIISVLSKNI